MTEYKNWSEIPNNLKTKSELKTMGLKPCGSVAATKWDFKYKRSIDLYDIKETKEVKKATEKQLLAIEKARATKKQKEIEKYTCPKCNKFRKHHAWEYVKKYDMTVCESCYNDYVLDMRQERALKLKNDILNNSDNYLIIDIETTGVEYWDIAVEIAIIDINGKTLLNTLINSDVKISSGAYYSHRISEDMIKDAPNFLDIVDKIDQITKDKTLIFYHKFALEKLYSTYRHHDKKLGQRNSIIIEALESKCLKMEYRENQLALMGKRRALSDCLDMLELIKQNKLEDYKEEVVESDDINELLNNNELPF